MRFLMAPVAAHLQKLWKDPTIDDLSRIFCVAIGLLIAGLIVRSLGADGMYIEILIVASLFTAAASAGCMGSYFVGGFVKAALTGAPRRTFHEETWLKNEFKDRVKHIVELPLLSEDKQAKINAAYIIFTDEIDKIREGRKEDT